MKLGTKIMVCAAAGVLLATGGAIATVYAISHTNRVNEFHVLLSSIEQQAEAVMANVDALHREGAFDALALARSVKQSRNLRDSAFYKAIPVVAAWDSV